MNTPIPDALPNDALNNSLWHFSLALYGRAPVAALCLELQDRHGGNVNVLLWCCWLGQRGHYLTEVQLAQATQRLAAWEQAVVQPLRQLRRSLKHTSLGSTIEVTPTRDAILAAELRAEQQAQAWLYRLASELGLGGQAETLAASENVSGANIASYLRFLDPSEPQHWLRRWQAVAL